MPEWSIEQSRRRQPRTRRVRARRPKKRARPPAVRRDRGGKREAIDGRPGLELEGGGEVHRLRRDRDGVGEPLQRLAHPRVGAARDGLGGGDPLPAARGHLGPPVQLRGDAQREHEALVRGVVAAAAVAPAAQRGARLAEHAGLLRGLAPGRLVHGLVQLPPALGDQHAPRGALLLRADHQDLHLAVAPAHAVRDAAHHHAPARARAVPLQLPALARHHNCCHLCRSLPQITRSLWEKGDSLK
uniref:Uncharacterized protein n=1 Tax=Zea mays TaxID=4577 RepID=A0A804QYY0_MAIZE